MATKIEACLLTISASPGGEVQLMVERCPPPPSEAPRKPPQPPVELVLEAGPPGMCLLTQVVCVEVLPHTVAFEVPPSWGTGHYELRLRHAHGDVDGGWIGVLAVRTFRGRPGRGVDSPGPNTTRDSTSPIMRKPFRDHEVHFSEDATADSFGSPLHAQTRPRTASSSAADHPRGRARPQSASAAGRSLPRVWVGKKGVLPVIGMRVVLSEESRIWRTDKLGKEESGGTTGIVSVVYESGNVFVKWDNGCGQWYSAGCGGKFELLLRKEGANGGPLRPRSAAPKDWDGLCKNTMSVRY